VRVESGFRLGLSVEEVKQFKAGHIHGIGGIKITVAFALAPF
jgi:hypothetical protein